jgi:hypothetical protein
MNRTNGADGYTGPAIEVFDLTVAYKEQPVLWDIDFEVPQGVFDRMIIGGTDVGPRALWVMGTILLVSIAFIVTFLK